MRASIILAIAIGIAVTSAAQAQGANPPGVDPTHYQCYSVIGDSPHPLQVLIRDQFVQKPTMRKVGNLTTICVPAWKGKDGEVTDKITHYACYTTSGPEAKKWVTVQDQFGTRKLRVGAPVRICLPATKKEIPRG